MLNKNIFRKFNSSQDADEWAAHNFGQWIEDIRPGKDNLDRNNIGYLKGFAKEHHYDCILKLYLPKGKKGAYLKFDNSILNEQEVLLPPNSTFRLAGKYPSFRYGMVYECELISQ